MCEMRADLQLIVSSGDFEILCGASDLVLYQFNTHVARHSFCRLCGIHPFNTPRSNPEGIAVNVRCLDHPHRSRWSVENFDGENWEQSVERLRASQAATGGAS
jgi:hypothetical protein